MSYQLNFCDLCQMMHRRSTWDLIARVKDMELTADRYTPAFWLKAKGELYRTMRSHGVELRKFGGGMHVRLLASSSAIPLPSDTSTSVQSVAAEESASSVDYLRIGAFAALKDAGYAIVTVSDDVWLVRK